MERRKFTVYGRVQRVGYRDRVAEIARKLGVKGFAHNLDDEVSVEIVAEGENRQLEEFARQIRILDTPIEVERIEEKNEAATGEFRHFKIIRGEPNEELGERVDVASGLLYGMSKKQDITNEKLDTFHSDTTGRFDIVDTKYGKISDKLEKVSVSLDTKLDNISASLGKLDKISVSLDKLVVILGNFGK